jgi:Zn-finger nucleic acid-binding protein
MLCPTCKVELKMADRQGIEIDYCPRCRGVWLDRGELDKIVERSLTAAPIGQAHEPAYADLDRAPARGWDRGYRRDDDDDDYDRRTGHRRRRGWLGELLDFD